MQDKNKHSLKKADLLAIIEEQQREIDDLKKRLDNIKEAHEKIIEYLNTLNTADESNDEEDVQDITKEENIENTNKEKTNCDENPEVVIIEPNIIDTKEESQNVEVESSNMMLIPIQTDLAIISPIFIKRKKYLMFLVYAIAFLVIIFSLSSRYKVYSQDNATVELTENLKNCAVNNTSNLNDDGNAQNSNTIDFDELCKINSDTCGWLKVDGIEIDMPVVQTDNNDYYLKYSFDKTYNLSGWAFVDYRDKLDDTDKNIVIYGHNRRDNIMFSPLINILSKDWYNNEDNKYVVYTPKDGTKTMYEIFSIYQTEVEEYYMQTDFKNDAEYQTFLETIKNRSIKKYDTDISTNDQIITLSTCGNNSKYRVILHAKRLKNI